LLASEVL